MTPTRPIYRRLPDPLPPELVTYHKRVVPELLPYIHWYKIYYPHGETGHTVAISDRCPLAVRVLVSERFANWDWETAKL